MLIQRTTNAHRLGKEVEQQIYEDSVRMSTESELLWALETVLDALGALSNPSELSGRGISEADQARILSAIRTARGK